LQGEYHHLEIQVQEYLEQNKILKHNAQHLLDQNEDFAKMVSELSRYYYNIRQGAEKVQELQSILGIYDAEMEKKLMRLDDTEVTAPSAPAAPQSKQFF
jgi:N-acetyl-anhydromuramyl-L-alanine amidase AmpD